MAWDRILYATLTTDCDFAQIFRMNFVGSSGNVFEFYKYHLFSYLTKSYYFLQLYIYLFKLLYTKLVLLSYIKLVIIITYSVLPDDNGMLQFSNCVYYYSLFPCIYFYATFCHAIPPPSLPPPYIIL